MPNEIELFSREKLNFKERFYKLMDLFLSKCNSKNEAIFYKSIYYIQLLSLFYSEQIHIFNKKSKSDEIFLYIQKIMRIKDLFRSKRFIQKLLFIFRNFYIYYFYYNDNNDYFFYFNMYENIC